MVLDDYAKANVFNKYFASIGNIDRGPVPNFPSLVNNEKCMRDVTDHLKLKLNNTYHLFGLHKVIL